jgi:hypothetical protein
MKHSSARFSLRRANGRLLGINRGIVKWHGKRYPDHTDGEGRPGRPRTLTEVQHKEFVHEIEIAYERLMTVDSIQGYLLNPLSLIDEEDHSCTSAWARCPRKIIPWNIHVSRATGTDTGAN